MSCSPSSTRPRSTAARGGSVGGFEALQQIGHALFEMGEGRRVVVADRDAVEPLGQRAQRAFEMFRIVARGRRLLAAFQRRGQRGDALLEACAKASLLPSERAS